MGYLTDLYIGKPCKKKLLERVAYTLKRSVLSRTLRNPDTLGVDSERDKAVGQLRDFYDAFRCRGARKSCRIASPGDAVNFLHEYGQEVRECFFALTLDRNLHLIEMRLLHVGPISQRPLHPCNVFTDAITDRAAGIIVAHCYPDGDPEARPEHFTFMERLKEVGAFINIELLDHLVITNRGFLSFQLEGRL